MYMKRFMVILMILFWFGLNAEEKKFDVFNKKNIEWFDAQQLKAQKRGFKNGTSVLPAQIWFGPTQGKRRAYIFALKPIIVEDLDYLLFKYLIVPGTYLTMDVWWDKGKMKRTLYYVPGKDEWQTLKLPVAGKKIKIIFSVIDLGKDKSDLVRKVSFMPIEGIKEKSGEHKLYKVKQPVIIPEPKKIVFTGKNFTLIKNGKLKFEVSSNEAMRKLKAIIIGELAEYLKVSPEKITKTAESSEQKRETIIDLQSGEECKTPVPDKKEAYAIKSYVHNGKNIITLAAKDKAGLYWAWQTLKQLLIKKNNDCSVIACNLTDWPDYEVRGFITYDLAELKEHLRWKSNINTLPWWGRVKEWRSPGEEYRKKIESLTVYALERGCDINFWVCPFFYKPICISSDADINTLMSTHEISLAKGGRCQFLGIDDGGRSKESFVKADRKKFKDDVLLSHAWFAKKLSDKIFQKYPDAKVFIGTKDYESAKGVEGYYDRIGVSKKLLIGWTGPQCVTFDYPKYIVDKYIKGIGGRRFFICDNTPGQAHGMYRELTVCEKYGEGYDEIYKSGKCVGVKPNYSFSNPMRNIRSLAIAEYMWNASRYNAEKARQRAIVKVAKNPEALSPILRYADEYLKIAYKYPVDKRLPGTIREDFCVTKGLKNVIGRKVLEDKELSKYSMENNEYKRLLGKIADMELILKEIDKSSRNKLLTAEFHLLQDNLKKVIKHIKENSIPLPVVKPEGSFAFDINRIPGGTNYKTRGPDKTMSACLYGNQTATNTFTAVFEMTKVPVKDVVLELSGWDCDKSIPPMVLEINGHKIFSGKTRFARTYPYKTGPGKMSFKIPAKYFSKTRNELKIINNSDSSDMIDNWLVIAEITFKFNSVK